MQTATAAEVRVGHTVLVYPDGRKGNRPIPAIVTGVSKIVGYEHPMLTLSCIIAGKQTVEPRANIRHVDDPFWKDPSRRTVAMRDGAWDYLE